MHGPLNVKFVELRTLENLKCQKLLLLFTVKYTCLNRITLI